MPIGNYSEMLKDARDRGYGIPSYNVFNYETMRLITDAAELAGLPCILMLYPGMQRLIPMEDFAAMARPIAARAKVPVGIHLDHSVDLDEAYKAISLGFLSVMYDGSRLPPEVNAAHTRLLVSVAHAMGVDVEAELGLVGSGMNREDFKDTSLYTRPEEAAAFAAETGVDALAVAIGNSHGVYIEEPNLDIPLLIRIREQVEPPLVLHGTSHIPDAQLAAAVAAGIAKVNIATEFLQLYGSVVAEQCTGPKAPGIIELLSKARPALMDYLAAKFRLLNPKGVSVI